MKDENDHININCVDPLGRSALLMAIDNENLDMVDLLINYNVDTKDALLHAISEEFVEAVEMLLDHEDQNEVKEGQHVRIPCNSYTLIKLSVNLHIFVACALYTDSNSSPNGNRYHLENRKKRLLC